MKAQNTIQINSAYGDAVFTNKVIAANYFSRLSGVAFLQMFDGRFLVTSNRRAWQFAKDETQFEILRLQEIYA